MISTIDIYNMCKLKSRNHIVFIRQGVFYITIGTDAFLLNKILGLKLSDLSISVKVGFPVFSMEKYKKIMENYDIPFTFMDDENTNVLYTHDGNFDFVEKTDRIIELLEFFYMKDEFIENIIKYGKML